MSLNTLLHPEHQGTTFPETSPFSSRQSATSHNTRPDSSSEPLSETQTSLIYINLKGLNYEPSMNFSVSVRRADYSSRGVLPTVVRRCVWSRDLVNDEALAHWGQLRHKKKPLVCLAISTQPRPDWANTLVLVQHTYLMPYRIKFHSQCVICSTKIISNRTGFQALRKSGENDYWFRHVCLPACACPSAWNSSPTRQIFMKFDVSTFRKPVPKLQI